MNTIDQHRTAKRTAMALIPALCLLMVGCETTHEESSAQPNQTLSPQAADATPGGGHVGQMDPAEWAELMNTLARKNDVPPSRFHATVGADGKSIVIRGDRMALELMRDAAIKPLDELAKGSANGED